MNSRPQLDTASGGEARRADDEGAATSTTVILFPMYLLLFLAVVQWGLYWHAQAQVDAAAQDAARATQAAAGTAADGDVTARALLTDATNSGLIQIDTLIINRDDLARQVHVQIDATVRTLVPIPGFNVHVRGVADGPIEMFVPEPNR